MKLRPWRWERQQPFSFAPVPAGLWLQKAFGNRFGEPPSSSSPLLRQRVFGVLPGGNSGQQLLKGQPTASTGGLICPPQKHHQHRAPRPTWDVLREEATPKRCSLEWLSPRHGASPSPVAPGAPSATSPSLFPDTAMQPGGSCEFKATGTSAFVRNTKVTGFAKIKDPGRQPS